MNRRVFFAALTFFIGFCCACTHAQKTAFTPNTTTMDTVKMKVEIWSDVMCPFCYIGKRKFEQALAQFPDKDYIQIEWKSFELNPSLKTDTSKSVMQYLAEAKGVSLAQAKEMMDYANNMAAQVGLTYHMEKAVLANSFNAHRFSHFAKAHGKQHEAEEQLFNAYFTQSKNTDDEATLLELGAEIGLDTAALKQVLQSNQYADEVKADEYEAQQLGVRGVPFFVFDRKVAVSGAQDPNTFLGALTQTYTEFRKNNPLQKLQVIEGAVCKPDGTCD